MNVMKKRFWSKVNKTKTCWNWIAGKTIDGYGSFNIGHRMENAHRVSFKITYGDIPNGLHCLHKCDNRVCVNPEHLFLGTNSDNVKDRVIKKRSNKGENVYLSKLNYKQVLEIKEMLRNNILQLEIAKKFNVLPCTISKINIGLTWKHVKIKE